MRIAGKRVKSQRLIQTEKYVVAVEVEMVILPDDPSEPCYEAETIDQFRPKLPRGNAAELLIDQRQQAVESTSVAPAPLIEQLRDIQRNGHQ